MYCRAYPSQCAARLAPRGRTADRRGGPFVGSGAEGVGSGLPAILGLASMQPKRAIMILGEGKERSILHLEGVAWQGRAGADGGENALGAPGHPVLQLRGGHSQSRGRVSGVGLRACQCRGHRSARGRG
eukprot:3043521-Pyramimonas_sp.AAC.1